MKVVKHLDEHEFRDVPLQEFRLSENGVYHYIIQIENTTIHPQAKALCGKIGEHNTNTKGKYVTCPKCEKLLEKMNSRDFSFKTVLMPIEVPIPNFCHCQWGLSWITCKHFDNEGGHGTCDLGFSLEKDSQYFYPKPDECLKLTKEIKDGN